MLALALAVGFAAPPQQAVLAATASDARAKAVRTNIVGNYALVRVEGGADRGVPIGGSILLERFSFGWQALVYTGDTCYFSVHGISMKIEEVLTIGQPMLTYQSRCSTRDRVDRGSPADVDAVRRLVRGPFVPAVVVSGRYAIGSSTDLVSAMRWVPVNQSLFERAGSSWHRIAERRGHLGMSELQAIGVPASSMCPLRVYDAKCPAGRM